MTTFFAYLEICRSIEVALSSLAHIPGNKANGREDITVLARFGCGHDVFLSSDDDDAGENSISDKPSIKKCHVMLVNDDYKSQTGRHSMEDETSPSTSTLYATVACPWSGDIYIKKNISL